MKDFADARKSKLSAANRTSSSLNNNIKYILIYNII